MLSLLHIENIALIESADIQFDRGFNVLTGETGAGKSIVVDAIGAVIGERTSRDLIRTGAKSALVSGQFTMLPDIPWLSENGITPDNEEGVVLQRELQPDGRNVCRVNGRPVTVAQLRELGHQLLNIHGQHDGQQLLDESCHIDYLDSFGGLQSSRAVFFTAYEAVAKTQREIQSLEMDEMEKSRKLDNLSFQIAELERAELKPGEEEALQSRRSILRNAGKLMEAVEQAYYALSGGDDDAGAVARLMEAEQALRVVGSVSSELGELSVKAEEARCAAEDLAERVRDLREEFDFSPNELDEVESRLDVLYRLKKKYGSTVDEMLDYLEHCRRELEQIQDADDTLERLKERLRREIDHARKLGGELSSARGSAAEQLKKRIESELAQLDMPKVRFEVSFQPKGGELGMDATGMDQVEFLMSANTGEALKPIQKVASGGELARIMLAMKNVLAENDHISTLVFDEVDTGVSGRAAQKVARKMASVARCKQVLCVTHLPQIAAMADFHLSVEKGERSGRTYTQVALLDEKGRMEELARLTSGDAVTSGALENARELLREAEEFKAALAKDVS